MRLQRRSWDRRVFWSLVALGAATVVGLALVIIVEKDATLGSLLLDWSALMSAIILGSLAFRAAARQISEAQKATVYANQPILVPLHEAAVVTGPTRGQAASYPAVEAFPVPEADPEVRIFRIVQGYATHALTEVASEQALLYLNNVGQGPAIITRLNLRNLAGFSSTWSGTTALGPGGSVRLVITLQRAEGAPEPGLLADKWRVSGDVLAVWKSTDPRRLYLLEITYDDVFLETKERQLRAWYDPAGRGRWQVEGQLAYVQQIEKEPWKGRSS